MKHEYYVTYEVNVLDNFQEFAVNHKKIKDLGRPPEDVCITIEREFIKKDDKIDRSIKNRYIYHTISWKKRNETLIFI